MQKALSSIEKILIVTGVLLFPIFVLPGFPSPHYIPKLIFLSVIVSLTLIVRLIRSIIYGEMKYSIGKFDLPLIILALVYLVSSIFKTPNKMEAFFYPGPTSFVILSTILYLVINQFTKFSKRVILVTLFGSGILLSVFMLLTDLKVFLVIPQLPNFFQDPNFNAMGSMIGSVAFLLTLLPLGISFIVREKDLVKKVFFGVSSLIILLSIILTGTKLLSNKTQALILPSWQTSWGITIDTLKSSPVWGAGPGNYLSAFNLFRPLSYNQTSLWQTRFSSANNHYFTMFTELGLAGIAGVVILFISIYRKLSLDILKKKQFEEISIVILLTIFALIPAASALILLFMILLSVFSGSEEKSIVVSTNKTSSLIISFPIFVAIILLTIFGSKAISAEMNYKKSLDALIKNDAKQTYDYMVKAIKLNPNVDRYRASLAQIDLALANSLATKTDITDSDRNMISQLVQESISEGKAAVTLNMGRSANWEVLAQIYRSILAFAQGADQFAIQTYSQAVALDPINPNLRISLGGIYYALGDFDNAITSFQMAIVAKSDFANAHYNLAAAYAAKKDYDKAITEMNTVLSLVQKDTDDYMTAEKTLEQYQKEKPVTNNTNVSENLTQPETITESIINPPIELSNEATPPATVE